MSAIPPPGVSRGHLPCSSSKGSISWGRPLAPARGERHQLASSMVECRSVLSPRGQMRETGCTPALVHRYGLFPDRNTLCPGTKDSLKPVSHTAQGRAVPHPAPSRGIRASAWPVPTGRASPSGKGVLSLHEGDTSRLGKGDDAHAPFCPRTRGTPGRMSGRRQSPGVLSRHEGRPLHIPWFTLSPCWKTPPPPFPVLMPARKEAAASSNGELTRYEAGHYGRDHRSADRAADRNLG